MAEQLESWHSRDYVARWTGEDVIADLLELPPADVIVTSRVLHHFAPASLAHVYGAAYELVPPGGFFFNLDHVGAPGDWEQRYRRIRPQFTGARKQELKPHRHDYPLAPV